MSGINLNDLKGKHDISSGNTTGIDIKKIMSTEITLFPVRFTDKNKEAFYLELSTLLAAGLDIKSSLELIEEEQVKAKHKEIIHQVKNNLLNGYALWESMQKSGNFTPYEFYSVQIGEETGKLRIVLDQLYQFYNGKLKQRRQIVSALSYPLIILFTSIGAVSFMLLFIVPMFSDVFKRFGGDLPYLTKVIIQFSTFIKSYFWIIAMLLVGGVTFFYYYRKADFIKKFSAGFVRRIPVVGKIVYSIQLARFCRSMSLLLGAKIPIIRSIDLVRQMISFYPIQITLDAISADILNGLSLNACMAKYRIYDRRMVSLLKVGEEANKLDVFFDKLSTQYSVDAEHQTSLLNTFLEPAMIIFLGFIVGFILLAMYMPMFQMSTTIGG